MATSRPRRIRKNPRVVVPPTIFIFDVILVYNTRPVKVLPGYIIAAALVDAQADALKWLAARLNGMEYPKDWLIGDPIWIFREAPYTPLAVKSLELQGSQDILDFLRNQTAEDDMFAFYDREMQTLQERTEE